MNIATRIHGRARGERDEWYTAAKLEADVAALRARGAVVETLVYPGAHEWTVDVAAAAGRFISRHLTT